MHPPQPLLSEDDAAIRLGITKELLFAYIRNAPKKHLGHKDKLKVVRQEQQCRFSPQDLEAWDKYLREPWSSTSAKRPPIPSYVDHYLKVECGGRCALCGKGHKLENAHIVDYALSLSHHHHNLIRLCTDCHSKYDDKIISEEEIRNVKENLAGKIREDLQEKTRLFSRKGVHYIPQPNPLFIGRAAELRILKEQLGKEQIIIVEGIGGIGKTQLVLQALHNLNDTTTIWLDVESYGSFKDLQLALLSVLLKEGLQLQAGTSLFEALNKEPLRIVLDGLDRIPLFEWDEVIDFLNDLAQLTKQPKVIITTQIELSQLGARFYKIALPPLSTQEGEQMLNSNCEGQAGIIITRSDASWLAQFCEGHALSLSITVGLLQFYKKSETVIERLKAIGTAELKDHARIEQRRSTSLESCLLAAYSCFNHDQKRLLQYVSNFPAGCLEVHARDWQKSDSYHFNLAQLRRFFFVEGRPDEWLAADRLHLLNPVRQFVRDQWRKDAFEEAASICIEAANNLMVQASVLNYKYFETGTEAEDIQYGLLRVEMELPNFIFALRYAEGCVRALEARERDARTYLELVSGMSFALSKYFFIRGMLQEGVYFIVPGIAAAEKLGQYGLAATQYVMMSNMQARMHDYEGHEETISKFIAMARRSADDRIKALASLSLGDVAKFHGRLLESVDFFERAANYFRQMIDGHSKNASEDHRYNTGMLGLALKSIGEVYELLQRPQEALMCHLEALDCITKIGDHTNIGTVYHQIGNCYADLGDVRKAVAAYKEALCSFYQLGYKQYISNAMGEMGKVVAEVEGGFTPDLEEFLFEAMLREGLEDIKEEIRLLTSTDHRPVEDDVKMLAKLFGIVKLISFTTKAGILKEWAKDVGDEIVAPLLATKDDDPDIQHESFRRLLHFITSLAFGIGEINLGDEHYTEEHVFKLCIICDLMSGWPSSKPFEWLATLLRYHEAYPNTTSHHLRESIKRSIKFEDRSLFKLGDV